MAIGASSSCVSAQSDPLPSWNDTPAKQAIIQFVGCVTMATSADFVAPPDRIATFDNDGTLWVEQPMYVQQLLRSTASRQFGESPSETLRRPAQEAEIFFISRRHVKPTELNRSLNQLRDEPWFRPDPLLDRMLIGSAAARPACGHDVASPSYSEGAPAGALSLTSTLGSDQFPTCRNCIFCQNATPAVELPNPHSQGLSII